MRRVVGWVLVGMAAAGLFPLGVQVSALREGRVETPGSDPAAYRISAANGLVTCQVPTTLVLQKETATAGSFFACTNNHNAPVTLDWSVHDDGGDDFLAASGTVSLAAAGVVGCRLVTLTAGSIEGSRTVVFRGKTPATAGLYVELYFTGQVTVQAGTDGLGGGCV